MSRPVHDGSVWELSFIRVQPGMRSAYDKYLAGDWKKEQEALKAEGVTLSYKVIGTESHSPNDWNLMLMVEFKDLASLESNQAKADAVLKRTIGDDEKVMQGYKERSQIREVMGTRQAGLPEFRVANLVRDLDTLQAARKEAEFYINQRKTSPEAAKMIKRAQGDARMKLAAVG